MANNNDTPKNMDDDPVIAKFRNQFQSKDPTVLTEIFSSMTDSVYQGKAKENNKMKAAATERWGGIAAKFRSLNLIEFKIAMYRFKSAGLTFEEIRRIFLWLDRSGNGRVEYDEFVAGIRVRINHHNLAIVLFLLTMKSFPFLFIIGRFVPYSATNRSIRLS